ncbi:MAG: AAA-like domain-containing protein [Anaerolineae bacterium]
MRYFNTHGPVNADQHFVAPRTALVNHLVEEIDAGHYFTIYAPRQMGKTTLLYSLVDRLAAQPDFVPVFLSFQAFENWPVPDFLTQFGRLLQREIMAGLKHGTHVSSARVTDSAFSSKIARVAQSQVDSYMALWNLFDQISDAAPQIRVVLIIDEFDATPLEAISPLLQAWRDMYLSRRIPRALHSVILVGLQNIATLNLGRSSPFNIARQLRLEGFSPDEALQLLADFTTETGQGFAEGVAEEIHRLSGGHPFLVNRLAAILTEEVAPDRTRTISEADLQAARRQLETETNYNCESLVRHAQVYRDDVLNMLFGADYEFNLNNPLVHALYLHGVITRGADGNCRVANPIYTAVLLAAFRPLRLRLMGDILANGFDFRTLVVDGVLQMSAVLSQFRQFVERRGRAAFKVSETPQEATGQYLLTAYLDLLARQVGAEVFTEVPSGAGILDVIVLHRGRRYVIETKIWRGQVSFEAGLAQLCGYLASEGEQTGYFVVFHARPGVYGQLPDERLEFAWEQEHVRVFVYLVRLGAIFDAA